VKGKYAYMAPEQWGDEEVDGRSDVFALAASLHEALTGKLLFDRPTPMATMAAIVLQGPPPAPSATRSDVPAELDRIVMKGLAGSLADRYASADALRVDLEALATSLAPELADRAAREQRLATLLRALFPGEAEREPVLDRKPPSMRFEVELVRPEEPVALQLAVEAEIEGDAMLREQRSRQRVVALVVALLVVATIAFVVVNLR
jgi:serine/threonine protein kinase